MACLEQCPIPDQGGKTQRSCHRHSRKGNLFSMSTRPTVLPPNSAAAYVRMSTEHQQYSTSNQMDVIREFAKRRGTEIVKIYSDEGKSGLSIHGRDELSRIIKDVQAGPVEFDCILVYDVSR